MSSRRIHREQRLGLEITGRTTDGKPVLQGCFKLLNERGMPLPILLDVLEQNKCVLDWNDLIQSALLTGWTPKALLSRIEEAVYDVFEESSRKEVLTKVHHLTAQVVREIISSGETHGHI